MERLPHVIWGQAPWVPAVESGSDLVPVSACKWPHRGPLTSCTRRPNSVLVGEVPATVGPCAPSPCSLHSPGPSHTTMGSQGPDPPSHHIRPLGDQIQLAWKSVALLSFCGGELGLRRCSSELIFLDLRGKKDAGHLYGLHLHFTESFVCFPSGSTVTADEGPWPPPRRYVAFVGHKPLVDVRGV